MQLPDLMLAGLAKSSGAFRAFKSAQAPQIGPHPKAPCTSLKLKMISLPFTRAKHEV